jgi:hypothetical protein
MAWQAQFASSPSNAVSQNTEEAGIGANNFTKRHLEVFFDSNRFGTLSLGQGNTATEGISEIDLSGTNTVVRSNFGTFGGGLLFRNSTTGALSATAIGNVFDNFDGLGRDDRIRYDTPQFADFELSGSVVQGSSSDIALRYGGDFDGTKVVAGVGLASLNSTSATIDNQVSGSASILFENGINLTGAAGVRDMKTAGADDPDFYYGKAGYQTSLTDLGKTSFSIEAAQENDLAANGDEGTLYGVGAAQRLDDWGTEVYAGARVYELDRPGANFDNIIAGMVGAWVRF